MVVEEARAKAESVKLPGESLPRDIGPGSHQEQTSISDSADIKPLEHYRLVMAAC